MTVLSFITIKYMSKQSSLQSFLGRKAGKKATKGKQQSKERDKSRSRSRQNSAQTQRLDDDSQVKLQMFEKKVVRVCQQLVLIVPTNLIQYPSSISKNLAKIQNRYSKQQMIKFMLGNLRFHQIQNIKNLESIDDDQFWSLTMPQILSILIHNIERIDGKIPILNANSTEVVDLTRLDVLLVLASMFVGIMPKQSHENCVSFGELMQLRENEYSPMKAKARKQKLKCIIGYLKMMVRNEDTFDEMIAIQRTSNKDTQYLDQNKMDHQIPLRSVKFHHIKDKTIQDYYGKALMVDFANKRIGGGILRNGCVQEEILFALFPEAIVTKLMCNQLQDNQAIIIYGAKRFSKYQGYSDTFQFSGEYESTAAREHEEEKSVLIAIDAIDFNQYPTSNYQFSKKGVRREINKAFAGFQGAAFKSDEDMPVCTGKWGCGAFKGEEDIKFIIQWIACSEANREMIYITDSEDKIQEYVYLTGQLLGSNTSEAINILDEYYRCRMKSSNQEKALNLMTYIKQFVI